MNPIIISYLQSIYNDESIVNKLYGVLEPTIDLSQQVLVYKRELIFPHDSIFIPHDADLVYDVYPVKEFMQQVKITTSDIAYVYYGTDSYGIRGCGDTFGDYICVSNIAPQKN